MQSAIPRIPLVGHRRRSGPSRTSCLIPHETTHKAHHDLRCLATPLRDAEFYEGFEAIIATEPCRNSLQNR
jgi:hypothetical protein